MKKFFRIILLIINLFAAAALILSTLAGSIEPSRCVAISILSYAYVIFLLANIAFIIIWLCLSRWEFLISVAAIVARLSFIPLFFQIGGNIEKTPGDDVLRIMTFNCHSFTGRDYDNPTSRDTNALSFLALLNEEDPDVICLQEFYSSRHVKLADSLANRGYQHHFSIHSNSIAQTILFSRYPITQGLTIDKKSKFYADIDMHGTPVRICGVHLDSYQLDSNDFESFENLSHAKTDSTTHRLLKKFTETTRCHEQEWKEELLPLIQQTTTPFILTGDFNDTPASYIYQQATTLLCDPYIEQGRGFGTTYHGPYPAFRIDYILHTPDIEALSYKRISTPISDHCPIVVDLRIPSNQ